MLIFTAFNGFEETEYKLPIMEGDVISFMVRKSIVFWRGDDVTQVEIGLSSNGELVFNNIGTIIDSPGNYLYVTVTIPAITDCNYELMFYSTAVHVDCGMYAGSTLQDVIDDNITLGDVLECTLNDFL